MRWKPLDLRRKESMPPVGALTVLRLIPKNGISAHYRTEQYEVGRFKIPDGGRKAWWCTTSASGRDPVRLRKHYEIWWCLVPDFDGPEFLRTEETQ